MAQLWTGILDAGKGDTKLQLQLTQIGLSRGRGRTLLCFAAFWIGLQVLIVVCMIDWDPGAGEVAEYFRDCLRDIERLRIAITSIIRSLLEMYVGLFLVYCIFKKHRRSAVRKVATGVALTATVIAGTIISNFAVEISLGQAIDNAAPLIVALNKYLAAEGHSPKSLSLLVPKYVAAIPHTGLGTPHDFDYVLDEQQHWALVLPYFFTDPRNNHCLVYREGRKYDVDEKPKTIKGWVLTDGPDPVD